MNTLEKETEILAERFSLNKAHESIMKAGIRVGVRLAQKWISVDDDEYPDIIIDNMFSDYIFIKVKGYEHPFVGYYVNASDDSFFDFIQPSFQDSINQSDITHWRPIELK